MSQANPPTFSNTPYINLTVNAGDIVTVSALPGQTSPKTVQSVVASVSATTNQNISTITFTDGTVIITNEVTMTLASVKANGQQTFVIGKATML